MIRIDLSIFVAVLPDFTRVHAIAVAVFPRARAISAVLSAGCEAVVRDAGFTLLREVIPHR